MLGIDQAAVRAKLRNKSYWRLRYTDGRIVNEWECDWSLAPEQGRQSLRLYCPSGEVAELGSTDDATGRLFQLKVAYVTAGGPSGRLAHIIGIVDAADGGCRYAAWESPGRLVHGRDNVHRMQYQQVGRLAFDHLGVRP